MNGDSSPLRFTSHLLSLIVPDKRPKCARLSVTAVTGRTSANAALLRLKKITNNTLPLLNRLLAPPRKKNKPVSDPRPHPAAPPFTHIPVKLMFLQPASLYPSTGSGRTPAGGKPPSLAL